MMVEPMSEVDSTAVSMDATQDLEAVFRRYAPYVGAIALRMLGNESEVDDLVQDVFIEAHRGLSSVRDPQALRGWLARITVRVATRRLRRRRMRRWLAWGEDPDYESIADPVADTDQRALVSELYRALDRLPAADRVAWALRQLEGETLPRVAELAGCSLATAKRRIARAQSVLEQEVDRG